MANRAVDRVGNQGSITKVKVSGRKTNNFAFGKCLSRKESTSSPGSSTTCIGKKGGNDVKKS
jgi:hypothetical protein